MKSPNDVIFVIMQVGLGFLLICVEMQFLMLWVSFLLAET